MLAWIQTAVKSRSDNYSEGHVFFSHSATISRMLSLFRSQRPSDEAPALARLGSAFHDV